MKIKEKMTPQELEQKRTRLIRRWSVVGAASQVLPMLATAASAAETAAGPVESLNTLINLLFTLIRAGGIVVLVIGVINLATSIQSHDASQRVNGILAMVGGLIIFFLKEILAQIGVAI